MSKKSDLNSKWKRNQFKSSSFYLKSLEDFWICLFVFVIQVVCIYKACLNLHKYNLQSWSPKTKPFSDLCLYGFFIFTSIILLPLYAVTSLIKIGSYSNDNFKFGHDLDSNLLLKKLTKKLANFYSIEQKNLKTTRNYSNSATSNSKPTIPPLSTSSFVSSTDKSKLINSKYASFISFMRSLFSIKYFWKHFMPVSCLLHIAIAFFLLYPNLKFTSKEIEYGLRPKGYIHHSELDFLLERPLQRFSDSQSYFDSSLFSSYVLNIKPRKNLSTQDELTEEHTNLEGNEEQEETSVYLNRNQIKLQLISSSLNDIDQINYEPRITLEYFNFILALVIFAIRYAATLWYSNKFYSLIFSVHIFLFACLSLISYSSFEILYKFQSCFSNGIKIRLDLHNVSLNSNGTFQEVLFKLPFLTNPIGLEFTYLISMFLLLISSMPIFSYGIYQYKLQFKRLQFNFARLLRLQSSHRHEIEMNDIKTAESTDQQHTPNNANSSSNESCSSSSNTNQNTNNIEYLSLNKETLEDDSNDSLLPNKQANKSNKNKKNTRASANMMRSSSPSASSLSLDQSSMTIDIHSNNLKDLFINDSVDCKLDKSFYSIYKPFKNHIFALVILLIICVFSALIAYDYICLYQLTSDSLPFWSAVFHILFILWYILLWLVLTFKTKWPFEFTHTFKLNYWNFATKLDQFNNHFTSATSSSTDSSNYSANECVEVILAKNKSNRSSYLVKTKPSNPIISSACTTTTNLADYTQLTLPNSKKNSINNNMCMSQSMINNSHMKESTTNINNKKATSSSTSSLANLMNTNSLKNNQSKLSSNLLATVRNSTEVLMNNQPMFSNTNETTGQTSNSALSDYENYTRNNSFNNNLNKKQPSLRRLNQLMMTDSQRLAPVLENSTANKQNDSELNNQLMFLRRNIANSSYEDTKTDPNAITSSIYQSSILAVVNSQLDFSNNKNNNSNNINNNKSLNDSINTNTNDETLSLIKKEEDAHLEYDLVTTSIANRLSTQSNKSKASLLNYATINELEKRASAIITNSLTKKNKTNENRTSFKMNNNAEIQLNDLTANLQKLTKTIESSDSSYLTDSSPRSKQTQPTKQVSETSPKSNSSILSDMSAHGSSNSSSSSSILNKQLNLHDNDSGRHSMSDSPSANNLVMKEFNTSNKPYFNKSTTKQSAGTFSSKVTLSGTAVTLAQTMQSLEKHQQLINNEQAFSKKKLLNNLSKSRDSSLMTKSSSFCKVPVLPSSTSIIKGARSHSSNGRATSNSNINSINNSKTNIANINNNNTKSSNLSVNRNCSEL